MTGFKVASFGSAAKASTLIMDADIQNPHGYGFTGGMRVIGGDIVAENVVSPVANIDTVIANPTVFGTIKPAQKTTVSDTVRLTKVIGDISLPVTHTLFHITLSQLVTGIQHGIRIKTSKRYESNMPADTDPINIYLNDTLIHTWAPSCSAYTIVPMNYDLLFTPINETVEIRGELVKTTSALYFINVGAVTINYDITSIDQNELPIIKTPTLTEV